MTPPFLLSAFSLLLLPVCCSCTALVDVEHAAGSRYSAAVLIGSDATSVSRYGSWVATGINNSNTSGVVQRAVVTRGIFNLAKPAVTAITR